MAATRTAGDCGLPGQSQGIGSVTAGTSYSTPWVLMLRLFGLGVCGPRRGKTSSCGTLLQCKPVLAQLICLCPKPLLVIMGPCGKPAQGAGWDKKDNFQINLHHFQLPEMTHRCCCMSASARRRQKMGRGGSKSEGRTAFKTLKLHSQYFYWIPSQIQIRSKGVFQLWALGFFSMKLNRKCRHSYIVFLWI